MTALRIALTSGTGIEFFVPCIAPISTDYNVFGGAPGDDGSRPTVIATEPLADSSLALLLLG